VPDIAVFIYEAASHLARSRDALRRQDGGALRAAVLALRDASDAAGAGRMSALCGALREHAADPADVVEALLDRLADEFDQVARELQTARSA
jgi:hypothetical protein